VNVVFEICGTTVLLNLNSSTRLKTANTYYISQTMGIYPLLVLSDYIKRIDR